MNIQGFFSAAYTTTANAASSVYGFGKDIVGKGCSVCSSLMGKVNQVAGRFIPTAVSNVVQAHPKIVACISGGAVVGAVSSVAFRYFHNQKLEGKLAEIRNAINSIDTTDQNADATKAACLALFPAL